MRFPFSTPNPQARRLVNDNIGEYRVTIPFLPKALGRSPRSCKAPKGASPSLWAVNRVSAVGKEEGLASQEYLLDLLQRRGYTVVAANNGQEAMADWEMGTFDIILMDVQMPLMDGFAATAAIRQRENATGRHTPIIALTAHVMKGDREARLAAGMDAYASKPLRSQELFAAIDGLLPGGRQLPESRPPVVKLRRPFGTRRQSLPKSKVIGNSC